MLFRFCDCERNTHRKSRKSKRKSHRKSKRKSKSRKSKKSERESSELKGMPPSLYEESKKDDPEVRDYLIACLLSKIDSKLEEFTRPLSECESRAVQSMIKLSSNKGKLLLSKEEIEQRIEDMKRRIPKEKHRIDYLSTYTNSRSDEVASKKLARLVTPDDSLSLQLLKLHSSELALEESITEAKR
jgi:hypothetical protein